MKPVHVALAALVAVVWGIAFVATKIGLESFSFRTAILESNKIRGSSSWVGFVRHSRVPELPVVEA